MITATERGKFAMNSKPATGLQRKKEYSVTPEGRWYYPNPFKLKVYNVLFDWGDMDFSDCKVKCNEPTLWREVYDEVRGDLMQAGKLKTKDEAAEDRRLAREKELAAQVALVQKKGEEQMAKAAATAKPGPPQEIGKENPVVHNAGIRNGTVMETALNKAAAIEQFGSRLSEDGIRARKHMLDYSLSELKALDHDSYKRQKSHHIEYSLFHSNKTWCIKYMEGLKANNAPVAGPVVSAPDMPLKTPVQPPTTPEPQKTRKAISVLGTVPLGNIQPDSRRMIKDVLMQALAIIDKDKQNGYTFVTLDDPPEIEIRETIYY